MSLALFLTLFSAFVLADVESEFKAFMKENRVDQLYFSMKNLRHESCLELKLNLPSEKEIAVASSSKWVTSSIILRLVTTSRLSLNDTTGKVLGWKGEKGTIDVRSLLSFTSGLPGKHRCVNNPFISLESCVKKIYEDKEPLRKNTFDYGNTHMQVAARMAEVVTGKSWDDVVTSEFTMPLRLKSKVGYFTMPKMRKGRQPLAAGGLVISPDDYLSFLAMIVDGGRDYLSREILQAQAGRSFNDATSVFYSPYSINQENFEYGLGVWRECSPKKCTDSPLISSAGSFGFYPWIDRANGHYAVLAVEDRPGFSRKSYLFLKRIRGELLKISASCGSTKDRKSFP